MWVFIGDLLGHGFYGFTSYSSLRSCGHGLNGFFWGRRVFRPPVEANRLIFTKYINQNQFLL
jgi:hypothetical protein